MDDNTIGYPNSSLLGSFMDTSSIPYSKIIYISGPYRDGRGEYYVHQNIQVARTFALEVWRLGGVALCPHLNTVFFGGVDGMDDDVWLKGDLALLRRCDAILMITGWQYSRGAKTELRYATERGMSVLFSLEEVARFLLE